MQISNALAGPPRDATAGKPAATLALAAELLQLTQVGARTRELREHQDREDEGERRRRRRDERAAAAGAPPQTPRPADLAVQAGREAHVRAGDQARADQRSALHEAQQQKRDAFKQALADASDSGQRPPPQPSATPRRAAPEEARPSAAAPAESGAAHRAETKPPSPRSNVSEGNGDARARLSSARESAAVKPPAPAAAPVRAAPAAQFTPAATAALPSASRAPASPQRAAPNAGAAPSPVAAARAASAPAPAARPGPSLAPSAAPTAPAPASTARRDASRAVAAAPGENDANLARILRVVRSQLSPNGGSATIRLDPAELGTLRLHLDLRGSALALRIETETPAARRLLTDQLDALRQSLDAAGIQLERVELRPLPEHRPLADGFAQPQPDARHDERAAAGFTGRHSGDESSAASREAHPVGPDRDDPVPDDLEPAAERLVNLIA